MAKYEKENWQTETLYETFTAKKQLICSIFVKQIILHCLFMFLFAWVKVAKQKMDHFEHHDFFFRHKTKDTMEKANVEFL